jgi:hypothetical protein
VPTAGDLERRHLEDPRIARAGRRLPALTLLSCGSTRNCAAIGTYRPTTSSHVQSIAEHWNGTAWHITLIPASP